MQEYEIFLLKNNSTIQQIAWLKSNIGDVVVHQAHNSKGLVRVNGSRGLH